MPKPPRTVFHGTDAAFDQFDVARSLGAHFGTKQAALDRLKSTGRAEVSLETYEDKNGRWFALEENLHNRPRIEHGPFENEDAAECFCLTFDKKRQPIAFEIDVYRPLVVEDLGTWEFQNVTRFLGLHHPNLDQSTWHEAWNRSDQAGWNALKSSLQAAGYDCIAYSNQTEDPGSWSWIVWDNAKIHKAWTPGQSDAPKQAALADEDDDYLLDASMDECSP